jgi:ribosome-associated translation inhibitor RaiA
MQIQVNTDNHIEGSEELTREVESIVEGTLGRFDEWITRVVVQLSDEDGPKDHGNAIRCEMEARPEGHQPLNVTHQAATMDQALKGCVKKLERLLNDTKERLYDPKGATSFAGEQAT